MAEWVIVVTNTHGHEARKRELIAGSDGAGAPGPSRRARGDRCNRRTLEAQLVAG